MRLEIGVICSPVGDVGYWNSEDKVRRYVSMDMYLVMRANVDILAIVEKVFGFCKIPKEVQEVLRGLQ